MTPRTPIAAAWLLCVLVAVPAALAGGDWNDAEVQWQPFEQGLEMAKTEGKPILLVVYTEWCPHCTAYSGVFHDSRVVEEAKKFVMIRVDKDKQPEISRRFAPDGEYIPRTYFLDSDGALRPEIHAPRDRYQYFYDERAPESVLGGMDEAQGKLAPKKS